jgi:hydrogenase expression/formation protein HypC
MCLSIPVKVLSIDGETAEVSAGGALFKASLCMVEDVRPGDYILLHAGFAIQKLSESEAMETIRLFQEMTGSLDI